MASSHKYSWIRVDGSTGRGWRAKWVDVDGKPRSRRGFTLERDALGYAQDREAEARHGVVLGDGDGAVTVQQWCDTWTAGLLVREETRASYDYALSRILPAFGPRPLSSLRPSEIRAWRRGMRRQDGGALADSTGDKVLAVLASILRAAVHDGLLDRSPMPPGRGLLRPQRAVDPAELLTLEQVQAWAEALPPYLSEAPVVAASTGLRQGELLGLRLVNVDFLRRQVHVVEQLRTPRGSGGPVWGPTKTPAGVRTVPLPARAGEALARHLERFPAVAGEPIFRNSRGGRWRANAFQAAVLGRTSDGPGRPGSGRRGAGLPDWATWHVLRDVYASSLIRQRVDVRTVMALLGHVSAEETLRTYGRLWADAVDSARDAIDGLWQEPVQQGPAAPFLSAGSAGAGPAVERVTAGRAAGRMPA
jgi:integrase